MTEQFKASDFKLTFANSDFIWSKAPRPGLPLLRWPDGLLCEPVLFYFAHSAIEKRVKTSSMAPEAYALREWFVFLANNTLAWFEANDEVLEAWRTLQGWHPIYDSRGLKVRLHPKDLRTNCRTEKKLHYVFEFYRLLPQAMPTSWDGTITPAYVGENISGPRYPISSKKRGNRRSKREYDVWVRSESVNPPARHPRVATQDEIIALYNQLRGKGFEFQRKNKTAFPPAELQALADRNWTIARTMTAGGLRCEEVSILRVSHLASALYDSGIVENIVELEKISDDSALKNKIKQKVLSLENDGDFSFLLVKIIGKGSGLGKERHAPFSPQLVCDLLEWIWGPRNLQLRRAHSGGSTSHLIDYVFLSMKTMQCVSPGGIGDVIASGFRACHIKRSAHSLRGFFATKTAAALWQEYFAQNQYHFDQALINRVLDNLARFMGHSKVNTTIKFYLDQPLFKHLTKIGTPEALLFRELWTLLVMEKRPLSKKTSNLLINLTKKISESDDDSLLIKALELMVDDPRFVSSPRPSSSGLNLVYSES